MTPENGLLVLAALGAAGWLVLLGLRALVARISREPTDLGLTDGLLAVCPERTACVSTQSDRPWHEIAPIAYEGPSVRTRGQLAAIIKGLPGGQLVSVEDGYVHAVVRTRWLRHAYDLEFYFDEGERLIHFRSASRIPHWGYWTNRKRTDYIRRAFYGVN